MHAAATPGVMRAHRARHLRGVVYQSAQEITRVHRTRHLRTNLCNALHVCGDRVDMAVSAAVPKKVRLGLGRVPIGVWVIGYVWVMNGPTVWTLVSLDFMFIDMFRKKSHPSMFRRCLDEFVIPEEFKSQADST